MGVHRARPTSGDSKVRLRSHCAAVPDLAGGWFTRSSRAWGGRNLKATCYRNLPRSSTSRWRRRHSTLRMNASGRDHRHPDRRRLAYRPASWTCSRGGSREYDPLVTPNCKNDADSSDELEECGLFGRAVYLRGSSHGIGKSLGPGKAKL